MYLIIKYIHNEFYYNTVSGNKISLLVYSLHGLGKKSNGGFS